MLINKILGAYSIGYLFTNITDGRYSIGCKTVLMDFNPHLDHAMTR